MNSWDIQTEFFFKSHHVGQMCKVFEGKIQNLKEKTTPENQIKLYYM